VPAIAAPNDLVSHQRWQKRVNVLRLEAACPVVRVINVFTLESAFFRRLADIAADRNECFFLGSSILPDGPTGGQARN
jgi:hypothetical protein